MRNAAFLFLLGLLATFASHAGETPPAEPLGQEWTQREAQERQRLEAMDTLQRWHQKGRVHRAMNNREYAEAEEAETEAVECANRCFNDRDYRKARQQYRKALRIRFTQQVPARAATAEEEKDKDFTPPLTQRTFRLATNETRWIYERLAMLEQLIPEADLQSRQARSDESLQAEKLAIAYRRYGELLSDAGRLHTNASVRKTAEHARAQRVAIVRTVSKPLEDARAALEANRPNEAADALSRFQRQFGYFTANKTVNNLYRTLEADPRVVQAKREQAAAQLLELAKAALERGDYATARSRFETVSRTYAKTPADAEAQARLNAPKASLSPSTRIFETTPWKAVTHRSVGGVNVHRAGRPGMQRKKINSPSL